METNIEYQTNEEIWKDIEGYEGLYKVSNLGRIKRFFKNGNEHILKPVLNKFGYLCVGLYKNGIQKWFKVHRLVAMAFLQNPDNLPQVNHLDEDKTNNCVSNLEWCTEKYNTNYGTRNQKVQQKLSKQIDQYSLDGKFLKIWPSTKQIQRDLGISNGNICECCQGKRKSAGGFIWRYHAD